MIRYSSFVNLRFLYLTNPFILSNKIFSVHSVGSVRKKLQINFFPVPPGGGLER